MKRDAIAHFHMRLYFNTKGPRDFNVLTWNSFYHCTPRQLKNDMMLNNSE